MTTTTTKTNQTADEILVGITSENVETIRPILSKAFDMVLNPGQHWKTEIQRAVSSEEIASVGGLAIVEAAIVFFTGSRPVFSKLENGIGYVIEAKGYYATLGA